MTPPMKPALKTTLALSLLLAWGHAPLQAQTSNANSPATASATANKGLTLTDALNLVVRSHPSIQAARGRYDAAATDFEGAQYQAFPTVGVDTGSSSSGGRISTISITQPVYAFGRISNAIDASEKRVDQNRNAVNEVALDLQDKAVSAYFETLKARDRLRVAQDNLAAHQSLASMLKRRAEGGVASTSDLTLAGARLSSAQNEELIAQANLRKAQSALRKLINQADVMPQDAIRLNSLEASLPQLQDEAIAYSPTTRKLRDEAKAQQFEAKSAHGAAMPQVVIRGEQIEQNFGTQFRDSRVIAAIQYQPGAGLSAFSRAKSAEQRAVAAQSDVDAALLELGDKVTVLYNDMQTSGSQLSTLELMRQANRDLILSFYRQFQVGKRSWLDVLNAQRESAQTEYGYVDSYYAHQSAIRRLSLVTGRADTIGGVPFVGDLPTKSRLFETVEPLEKTPVEPPSAPVQEEKPKAKPKRKTSEVDGAPGDAAVVPEAPAAQPVVIEKTVSTTAPIPSTDEAIFSTLKESADQAVQSESDSVEAFFAVLAQQSSDEFVQGR